jgi:hypothetical protein
VSVTLVMVAALVFVAAGMALYVRNEVLDSSTFAERAVDALHQPTLQRVVAREIAVQVVEPNVPDLVAARPLIESATRFAVGSQPFEPVIRLAAEHGHRLLFERNGGNAVFDVANAGTVVASALRTLAPGIARRVPPRAEAVLLTLRRRSFAATTLRIAEHVRLLGLVLPPVALVLFVLAIAFAQDRRTAITRSTIAIGISAAALAIALELSRRYVLGHVYGANELTDAEVRGAVGDLWDAYLGDLLTWALAVTAVAWLIAAASASVIAPYSSAAGIQRIRALARRPWSARARAALGSVALVLGFVVIAQPTVALRVVAVIGGCLLVYVGAGEVLSALAPAQRPARPIRVGRRRLVTIGVFGVAVATGLVLAVALTGGASKVRASGVLTCNGYAQLCGRRLDEVAFAGTHNSMSAADSPGWLIANQDRTIAQQLQDGIRLFKISTHYGVGNGAGFVLTDIASEGQRLNRVAAKLSPSAREALQRLSRSLSNRSAAAGKRDIWLCHTLCELGATRMVDFLTVIRRFLELNPNQVIVLFDEDYVAERDLADAFKRSGLFRFLATLQPGLPLPTLAHLIRTHRNVLVFAQTTPSPKYPWDMDGFTWIQDTPLGATKPAQFTCRPSRGQLGNPLLMMNNWADIFPPRPQPNLPLVKRDFILARARQCMAQRGRTPNLILTDYYNRGDVVGAVAALNGVGGQRPATTVPLGHAG